MRFHYTSLDRWQAVAQAFELSASDRLTNDPDLPLTDDTRVRISVRMRRDAKRFVAVDAFRWYDVIDRLDNSIEWIRPIPICGPARSMVLDRDDR